MHPMKGKHVDSTPPLVAPHFFHDTLFAPVAESHESISSPMVGDQQSCTVRFGSGPRDRVPVQEDIFSWICAKIVW